ncbi:MAG: 30S ribosomal protein S16 [Candidatus Pacebacteria bacterium]|nr:30S ribosomal protein S16 [Candidatus Paceibacterota bacterium]MCF7857012.1 30S ribosomal protein S16 [Candidatus Paceibacterota bacterium]
MRLQRIGRKNNPAYRVVVTDSRNAAKRGTSVDVIGSYDPKAGKFQIDGEKAKHWISHGVQVSDTVHNFLISEKIIEGKKINALSKKSPIVDEAKIKAEAEAKAAKEAKAIADAEAKIAAEKAEAEAPAVAEVEEVVTEEAVVVETPAEEASAPDVVEEEVKA